MNVTDRIASFGRKGVRNALLLLMAICIIMFDSISRVFSMMIDAFFLGLAVAVVFFLADKKDEKG